MNWDVESSNAIESHLPNDLKSCFWAMQAEAFQTQHLKDVISEQNMRIENLLSKLDDLHSEQHRLWSVISSYRQGLFFVIPVVAVLVGFSSGGTFVHRLKIAFEVGTSLGVSLIWLIAGINALGRKFSKNGSSQEPSPLF